MFHSLRALASSPSARFKTRKIFFLAACPRTSKLLHKKHGNRCSRCRHVRSRPQTSICVEVGNGVRRISARQGVVNSRIRSPRQSVHHCPQPSVAAEFPGDSVHARPPASAIVCSHGCQFGCQAISLPAFIKPLWRRIQDTVVYVQASSDTYGSDLEPGFNVLSLFTDVCQRLSEWASASVCWVRNLTTTCHHSVRMMSVIWSSQCPKVRNTANGEST